MTAKGPDGSILPFPETPSASKAGYTLTESTHDRRPFRFEGTIARVDVDVFDVEHREEA